MSHNTPGMSANRNIAMVPNSEYLNKRRDLNYNHHNPAYEPDMISSVRIPY